MSWDKGGCERYMTWTGKPHHFTYLKTRSKSNETNHDKKNQWLSASSLTNIR